MCTADYIPLICRQGSAHYETAWSSETDTPEDMLQRHSGPGLSVSRPNLWKIHINSVIAKYTKNLYTMILFLVHYFCEDLFQVRTHNL